MKNTLSGSLDQELDILEESIESEDGLDVLAKEIAKIIDGSSYDEELELSFCDKYYYVSKEVDRPYYVFSPSVNSIVRIAPTTEIIVIDEYQFDMSKSTQTINCVTLHGLLVDLPKKHIIVMDLH